MMSVMDVQSDGRIGHASEDDEPRVDHFVHLAGVSWPDYQRVLAIRGDRSAPRMTYLEGVLEIMSPSFDHEKIRSLIGRLIEAYCLDHNIDFLPVGAWTLKSKRERRGVEPDECYVFGERRPRVPDLAIEVIWSSGGLDKLDVYRKLGVREVWVWRRGAVQVFALRGKSYRPTLRSRFLPDLEVALLARFLDRPTVTRAVRDFRAALAQAH